MTTSMVLGAAHSGRSRHARSLLAKHSAVVWLVPDTLDPFPDPPAPRWQVLPTAELGRALMGARTAVLVDDLDRWVRTLVEAALSQDAEGFDFESVQQRLEELLVALTHLPYDVVVVSSDNVEDGPSPDSRLPALLGEVNRRVSAGSSLVHLVVAGRAVDLSNAPVIGGP